MSTHVSSQRGPLRVGIGGPVGSGKTALTLALCLTLRDKYDIAVVTNDIYTAEDAKFLVNHSALAPERIIGVETGGCPHTAIREDASINLAAIADLRDDAWLRFHPHCFYRPSDEDDPLVRRAWPALIAAVKEAGYEAK